MKCKNCGGAIFLAGIGVVEDWVHEESGLLLCPDATWAEPEEEA